MGRPRPGRSGHLLRHPIRRLWNAALVAVTLVCLAAGPALAQATAGDWGQFQGGPEHGGSRPPGPSPPFELAWTFQAPKGTVSGPVVHGGLALTVGTTAVYAVEVSSGRRAWSLERSGGPIAMPAMAEVHGEPALLFTDGSKDTGPSLVAVALGDRTELWRTSLNAPSRSGVAVDGGRAFVADDDGTVYAVALGDGSLDWSAKTLGQVLAPPAAADGRVFVTARDTQDQRSELVALDQATGRRDWDLAPSVAGSTGSAPSVEGGTVIAGLADRSVHGLSASDGTPAWSALALSVFSPATAPAIGPDGVFVVDVSGGLYRLDPSTGERIWDHQLNELAVRSSPVVSGAAVLLGLNDGRLVAIDGATGNLVWQSRPTAGLIGPIAVAGDTIVASRGGAAAGLVAYVHDPAGTLLDVPSPTKLDPAKLLGTYAVAAVIVLAVVLVPGRLASVRVPPPAWEAWEEETGSDNEGEGSG